MMNAGSGSLYVYVRMDERLVSFLYDRRKNIDLTSQSVSFSHTSGQAQTSTSRRRNPSSLQAMESL